MYPAAARSLTIPKALRSVIPTDPAMSRSRAPGSRAMHSSTKAWLVRKPQDGTRKKVSHYVSGTPLLVSECLSRPAGLCPGPAGLRWYCAHRARPWCTLSGCPGRQRAREAVRVSLWCVPHELPRYAIRAPAATDRQHRPDPARGWRGAAARGRLQRRRLRARPAGDLPGAVAVAGTRRAWPSLSLLPRPGAGTRGEVPEPPGIRPPVARPARDRGGLGLLPLGAWHRRHAGADA